MSIESAGDSSTPRTGMAAVGLPGHEPCPVPTSVQGTEGQPRAQNICYGVKVSN